MEITIDEIKRLASLSRLEFSEEELSSFKPEFESIIEYVNQLQNVDTSKAVDQRAKVAISSLREDVAKQGLTSEQVVENAKNKAKGAFIVPTVVE